MASESRTWTITPDKFLTLEQVNSLINVLSERRDLALARNAHKQEIEDYYIIKVLLETGLRVFEFCDLQIRDLSGLRLAVRRGKGSKPRTVLLTRSTHSCIQEWLQIRSSLGFTSVDDTPLFPGPRGKRLTTRAIQKRVKQAFTRAGLPSHLSTHSLRHTYCSLLIATGKVGLATVRSNMGHSSLSITDLYSHAVGSIEDVELISEKSSYNNGKEELSKKVSRKKPNSPVRSFLRNAN